MLIIPALNGENKFRGFRSDTTYVVITQVHRFPASASLQTGSSRGFPAESGIKG